MLTIKLADDAATEEGVVFAAAGAVKKLIGQNDVTRSVFLTQAAYGGHANQIADADTAQCPNVSAMVDFCRQQAMAAAMARQEPHVTARHFTADESIARHAKGSFDYALFGLREAVHFIQTTASYDADCCCLAHGRSYGKMLRLWQGCHFLLDERSFHWALRGTGLGSFSGRGNKTKSSPRMGL